MLGKVVEAARPTYKFAMRMQGLQVNLNAGQQQGQSLNLKFCFACQWEKPTTESSNRDGKQHRQKSG